MIDMGIAPYLVASSVCGVLAQRLVRTICPKCKESYQPSEALLEEIRLEGTPKKYTFYRGKGCEYCAETGYRGRTGLFEFMTVDKDLRGLIHNRRSSDVIRDVAKKAGMRTLWEEGMLKVSEGITTIEEVRRAAFVEEG
jgi:type II secretory ATPase GspE/PulE/Tfp pilus assembly ATPase PilB-like protein